MKSFFMVFICVVVFAAVFAQVPQLINYQGVQVGDDPEMTPCKLLYTGTTGSSATAFSVTTAGIIVNAPNDLEAVARGCVECVILLPDRVQAEVLRR